MATAHGIVILNDKPERYSITTRIHVDGQASLYLKGRVADTFKDVFRNVITSVRALQDYLDFDIDTSDILLRVETPNNYPLAGGSYALPLALSILASAKRKIIPSGNCYTGGLNSDGCVTRVDAIQQKRRAAAGFGFERFFLPRQQIDLFSTYIAQCPCGTLSDAYALTFWRKE